MGNEVDAYPYFLLSAYVCMHVYFFRYDIILVTLSIALEDNAGAGK